MNSPLQKKHRIEVSLSDAEYDDLLTVANLSGLTPADVVATTFYVSTGMIGERGFGDHFRKLKDFAMQRNPVHD